MTDARQYLLVRGDARRIPLANGCVHCVVTSPPYFGLRDYGSAGQIGLEPTPRAYCDAMVAVFREVWRVLRDDGVVWLNIGDSYAATGKSGGGEQGKRWVEYGADTVGPRGGKWSPAPIGFKPKDRIGIPHRVVFALQEDGWYWRDEIVWHKRSPMPESVTDRTTKAHEFIFLLTKRPDYFYDAIAVRKPDLGTDHRRSVLDGQPSLEPTGGIMPPHGGVRTPEGRNGTGANLRSVWTLSNQPFPDAHFATMPPDLAERCIKAGTSEAGCCPSCGVPWERVTERTALKRDRPNDFVKRTGEDGTGNSCSNSVAGISVKTLGWRPACPDRRCPGGDPVPCVVFDPFSGAATTGYAATRLGRRYVGTDLSPDYLAMSARRIADGLRPVSKFDPKPVEPLPGQMSFLT